MSAWTDLLYRSLYGPPSNPAGFKFGGASPFGLHDYIIPGMPQTWDWSKGGRIGRWNSINGGEKTSCNGVISHISGSLDYKVEVRNMEVWIRANGSWARYYTTAGNDAALIFGSYFRTSNFSHNGSMTEQTGPAGGCMFPLRAFHHSHFYCKGSNANVNIPGGFQRLHVRAQYRLVGNAASSSIAIGRIGADYFIVDPSIPKGFVRPSVFIAPMLRVTDEWQWFTATTLEVDLIEGSLAPPEPGSFVGVPEPDLPEPEDPGEPDDGPGTPDLPFVPDVPGIITGSNDGNDFNYDIDPEAYNLDEISTQCGSPVELYEFRAGNQFWRYTSAEVDIEANSEVYLSRPLLRTSVAVTQETVRNSITLDAPRDLEVIDQFRITPPTAVVSLVILRAHRETGSQVVAWVGRLLNVSWQGAKAELQCEPLSTSFKRTVLRRLYQAQCPHVLYGPKCRAVRQSFVYNATVTAVDGNLVTIDAIDDQPYAGGIAIRVAQQANEIAHIHYIRSVNGLVLEITKAGNSFDVGDPLELFPGCDHTMQTCNDTFNNIPNYGGMPFIPTINPIGGTRVF